MYVCTRARERACVCAEAGFVLVGVMLQWVSCLLGSHLSGHKQIRLLIHLPSKGKADNGTEVGHV